MLTAWASAKLNTPVRMNVQFNTLVTLLGKRPAYLTNYKIGVDANGKLLAIQLDTYINQVRTRTNTTRTHRRADRSTGL